jgi:hypothetical protein
VFNGEVVVIKTKAGQFKKRPAFAILEPSRHRLAKMRD